MSICSVAYYIIISLDLVIIMMGESKADFKKWHIIPVLLFLKIHSGENTWNVEPWFIP